MSDPTKKYQLGLVWGTLGQYQVKTISNSTEFKPGEWISVAQAEEVCRRPNWQVTIADDQLLMQLFGMALSHVAISSVPL